MQRLQVEDIVHLWKLKVVAVLGGVLTSLHDNGLER